MDIELIQFTNEYLKFLEKWESTNELNPFLSHTRPKYLREPDPTLERHALFFLMQFNKQIIGAAWLEDITESDGKLGIYIAEKEYRGQGIGSEVVRTLADTAFKELKLQRIYLNVRETNVQAIKCYEKCGFKITEAYPKSHFADSSYQGAYQMTLFHELPVLA